jgi:hypothetical protein
MENYILYEAPPSKFALTKTQKISIMLSKGIKNARKVSLNLQIKPTSIVDLSITEVPAYHYVNL